MILILSDLASSRLEEIWTWNEERYGTGHADAYLAGIRDALEGLRSGDRLGRPVEERPGRFSHLHRIGRGHGYILVYQVGADALTLLAVYHTAQDWAGRLNDEY